MLLHVVDVTHPNAAEQADTVISILDELEVDDKGIITALNKVDQLDTNGSSEQLLTQDDLMLDFVPISAKTGQGIDHLLERIDEAVSASSNYVYLEVRIPYSSSELVNVFHRLGQVESEEYDEEGTRLAGFLPTRFGARFAPYTTDPQDITQPQDAIGD